MNSKKKLKFKAIFEAGQMLAVQNRLQEVCAKFREAVDFAQDDPWFSDRNYAFNLFCIILRERHFPATDDGIEFLNYKFLENEEEPSHYRIQASFCIGVLESARGKREKAAIAYRNGLRIHKITSTAERNRIGVVGDEGPVKVGYLNDTNAATIESNLSLLMGEGSTQPLLPEIERRQFGDQSIQPAVSRTNVVVDSSADDELQDVIRRATTVGGNACDKCKKTLEELESTTELQCCGRCRLAYYCSRECQKGAWKTGHKKYCREPDEIKAGDYMKVKNVVSKPDLNGSLVKVVKLSEGGERWIVQKAKSSKPFSM